MGVLSISTLCQRGRRREGPSSGLGVQRTDGAERSVRLGLQIQGGFTKKKGFAAAPHCASYWVSTQSSQHPNESQTKIGSWFQQKQYLVKKMGSTLRMNSFLFLERAVIEIKTIYYFPRALSYCSEILRNRNWIFTINKC